MGQPTIPPMAPPRDADAKLEFEKSLRFDLTLMAVLVIVVILVAFFIVAWAL